jgi:two-component system, cell cycle sensor histidine kinase and response regulator CckA
MAVTPAYLLSCHPPFRRAPFAPQFPRNAVFTMTTDQQRSVDREGESAGTDQTTPVGSRELARLAATLSALGDAVIVTGIDGTITMWTEAAELLLGWRAVDAVGRSLIAVLDPTPSDVNAPSSSTLLGSTRWQGPAEVRHRARGRISIHLSLTQVEREDGAPQHVVLRVRPWQARPDAARADELDSAVLERALEHVEDIVLITAGASADPASSRIVYVNEAFERTTGFRRDEVIGRSPAILRGPDTDRASSERIDVAIRERHRVREELLNYTKQGEPLWLDVDIIPVDGPKGAYTQWVALERNVTPQKGQDVALRAREERLRLALSAVWDGLWDWHVPTGYCYYAPRWYSMLGFVEHALPPHIDTFLDLLHPKDLATCEQALRDHFDGRTDTYAMEVRLRTADNTWRWVLTRGTVVERDTHGRPVRMVGTHTDIRERKQAEVALRVSEERFRVLTMAAPLGIFLTDAAGDCSFVTPRMLDLWGVTTEQALGCGYLDLAHPDDRARVLQAWQSAVRDGTEIVLEYRVQRPDGEVRWVCERTAPHRDTGSVVTGFVGTVEDITAQKLATDERRRLEAQMQSTQKLESLGVLAGGIAHDFNNLLVGIIGNVSVAREDSVEGTPADELLADIETAARRAAELTTQLLAYAGKGRFNVQPLDLSAAVRETSSLINAAISKRATLVMELTDPLPPIAADATQVRQVIMNLLTNASDALEEQNGEIRLRTGVMYAGEAYLSECLAADGVQPGEFVFVEVSDSGVGMDQATLARIFDPFFTTKFTGRGLGLAATLGIVRGHRGALSVTSQPGEGTTFRLLFPAGDARGPSRMTPRSIVALARQGTVLIVDDEPSVRDVARRMLERSGYRVLTADDGENGLKVFEANESEIIAIVLDVTMPRKSGTEALAELRQRGKTVPVVLASGYTADSIAATVAGDAATEFVQKPFVTSELLAALDAVLTRYAQPRA